MFLDWNELAKLCSVNTSWKDVGINTCCAQINPYVLTHFFGNRYKKYVLFQEVQSVFKTKRRFTIRMSKLKELSILNPFRYVTIDLSVCKMITMLEISGDVHDQVLETLPCTLISLCWRSARQKIINYDLSKLSLERLTLCRTIMLNMSSQSLQFLKLINTEMFPSYFNLPSLKVLKVKEYGRSYPPNFNLSIFPCLTTFKLRLLTENDLTEIIMLEWLQCQRSESLHILSIPVQYIGLIRKNHFPQLLTLKS